MSIKNFVTEFIHDPEEQDGFALWAFGETYKIHHDIDFLIAWNEIHGNDLLIKDDGNVKDDIKKMVALFNNRIQKEILSLKPCPWCKLTPHLQMFFTDDTWLPQIKCINDLCDVMPISKYVPIRNKQKYNPLVLREKIRKVFFLWNQSNPIEAYEGKEFDYNQICYDEIKCRHVSLQ